MDDEERLAQRFLIEKVGVDLGNVRNTLDQLREHLVLQGDVRTKVTVDVVCRRLQDIEDDARALTRRFLVSAIEQAKRPDQASLAQND